MARGEEGSGLLTAPGHLAVGPAPSRVAGVMGRHVAALHLSYMMIFLCWVTWYLAMFKRMLVAFWKQTHVLHQE